MSTRTLTACAVLICSVLGTVSPSTKLTQQGTMTGLRNSIYANTRTVLQSFANETRNRIYEENEDYFGSKDDYRFEYLATLDSRTCLVCGSLDGKLFKSIRECPNLPQHRGCRCVIVPYFNIEGDTRASKDGYTERVTFNEWLEKQDEKTKLDVLGKGRYNLYKSDKNIINSFVDNGKVIKLKDLYDNLVIFDSESNSDVANRALQTIRLKEKGFITNYKEKSFEEKVQSIKDWLIRKELRSGVERGVLIDSKGNILLIKKGSDERVLFDRKFLKKYDKDSLIFIHNHPNNSTLSVQDITNLNENEQIKTSIAVTRYGGDYEMTVKGERYKVEEFAKILSSIKGNGNVRNIKFANKTGWIYNYK